VKKLLRFAHLYSLAIEKLNMDLSLTATETKIFSLLKAVVAEKTPETILRGAGGWVRDKLLSKDSNDIDIAVNNMTGEAFANLVSEYMAEHGLKKQSVTVVEANPDQSKHLATAMIRLFGLPIDFVNLRTETYADSRIPTMEMGTAEEDAQRRDLTINSLFYNINSGEIEDFVGGINDLRAGIARTPLDPVQTFLDDPLRILRTVRFASKYGLDLDPALIAATHDPKVQEAFKTKISNERVWAELAGKKDGDHYKPGALIGPNPTRAVELLKELGLMEAVFDPTDEEVKDLAPKPLPPRGTDDYERLNAPPPKEERMVPWETPQNNPHHQFDIWNHTLSVVKNLIDQTPKPITEDQETYLVRNLAALLHDIGKRYTGIQGVSENGSHTSYHGHEEASAKLAQAVLTRLHAPQDIIKRVVDLISVHLRPHTLLENGRGRNYRRFVRDYPDWRHSVDIAIADNLGKQNFNPEEAELERQKYEGLRGNIQKAMEWAGKDPNSTSAIPRPISGKDLIAMGLKPGPIMGQILNALDEALLDNPSMSKEEALEFARTFIA
jgi:tRNA nucleotidyltransferase/poly(A) polymerase